jgi:fatty acid desaturase
MAGMDGVPKEILREAYQRKPLYLLKVPMLYGLWAGCAWLLYFVQDQPLSIGVPVGLACSLLITQCIRGLGAVAHDSVHGNCFKSKTLSYFLALLCWSPTAMSVTIYGNYHLHHHRIANTYPDVDNFVVTDYTKSPALAKVLLLCVYTFGYPIYFLTQMFRYVPRLSTWHKIRMHLELAGIFSLIYLAYRTMPGFVFLFFYGIPFVGSAVLASITSMIEHFDMMPGEDKRYDDAYSSRTYATKAHLTNFIWNNVSFHNEHHKFPGIPFYNLRSFHEAAYPHYDDQVKSECYETFWPVVFKLWGRIFTLDLDKLEERYRDIDRAAERQKSIRIPGLQPGAV